MLIAGGGLVARRWAGVGGGRAVAGAVWVHAAARRAYTKGAATVAGTQEFARRRDGADAAAGGVGSGPESFLMLPKARGLLVSRMGWGCDDVGKPINVRYRSLWHAVANRANNVVHLDLDSVVDRVRRFEATGEDARVSGPLRLESAPSPVATAGGGADDSDGVSGGDMDPRLFHPDGSLKPAAFAKLQGRGAGGGRTGRGGSPELADAVVWEAHALARLFESQVTRSQVVIVGRVALPADIAVDDVAEWVTERAEVALDAVGLEMLDVLMVELPAGSGRALEAADDQGEEENATGFTHEHLIELTECLDVECEEVAPETGEAVPIVSDDEEFMPLAQYFGFSFPRLDGATGGAVLRHITTASPSCLAAEFAWNAFDAWPVGGRDAASVDPDAPALATLQQAGVWTLSRKPFDMMWDGRPFRCVEVGVDEEQDPGMVAQKLGEVLNNCAHLELKFEEVCTAAKDAAARAEREGGRHVASMPAAEDAMWARVVSAQLNDLDSVVEWEHVWGSRVWPAVNRVAQALGSFPASQEWAQAYKVSMHQLNSLLMASMAPRHQDQCAALRVALSEAGAPRAGDVPVQLSITSLLTAAGVGTVMTEEQRAFAARSDDVSMSSHAAREALTALRKPRRT